ncbi:hypothetical protein Q7C_1459 [Methylophaga frappieri]|uniref:DUF2333 domain-containing protein n=1 Tax=Methylophaga frappieri (strain ATCC BAA-2434 / DSM 25690 / JAM7) TaxID=754477 RepID=I1YI65_METFJ|nr:DUF2333 family protein [Methylophaga frappieri]AFJ02608.1 hypothetical protein Q7C_1459 [Methylophaga frappieri]
MADSLFLNAIRQQTAALWARIRQSRLSLFLSLVLAMLLGIFLVLMIWWSMPPAAFSPTDIAHQQAERQAQDIVTGSISTATVIHLAETLLEKPGGYLSNDVMPPSVWMDNMPNWEFGVLVQVRDYTRALRNDLSRSQSQSAEDKDLVIAEPQFNFDSESWLFPPTEVEYREAIDALKRYHARLSDPQASAQFYARADNLVAWLAIAEKRLGSLSQRLSASVGQVRINTDLAGDPAAHQSTANASQQITKTPWTELDDNFFEARGSVWALIHLLKAADSDFADVLAKKNARVSLQQIIRELEATQKTLWTPIILNGSGFGMFANHSLVMASYISRANAAMIDLRRLLEQG